MSLETFCAYLFNWVLVVLICVTKLYFIHFFNDFFPDRSRSSLFFYRSRPLCNKKSSLWAFVYFLLVSTLHCTYSKVNFWVLMWQALWRFQYDLSLFFGGCPRLLKPPLKGCFWKKADLFFSLERLVSFWRCPRQSSFWSDVLTYLRTYLLQHGSESVRPEAGDVLHNSSCCSNLLCTATPSPHSGPTTVVRKRV